MARLPEHRGANRFAEKRAELLAQASGLASQPATYDVNKRYRIRLKHAVPAREDGSHVLRPADDVVVSGAFAEANRAAIIGAIEVTGE